MCYSQILFWSNGVFNCNVARLLVPIFNSFAISTNRLNRQTISSLASVMPSSLLTSLGVQASKGYGLTQLRANFGEASKTAGHPHLSPLRP